MLTKVITEDGQVSGVNSLSGASSSMVNWEIDDAGINTPRPPLVTHTITGLQASPVVGLTRWARYIIVVTSDRYIHAINNAVPATASVRSSSTTSTQVEGSLRPTFVEGADYVYVAGGGRIQRWNQSLPFSERLTDSPHCTHIASIGERLVSNDMTDRHSIRWSDIGEGSFATLPTENNLTLSARPDPVIALAENINELFAWGETSLQVFRVGSDPNLPFDLVASINTGIAAPHAYVRIDESFAFLDNHRRIVISDGRVVNPISDAIGEDLRSFTTVSDCWAFREERGQFSYIVFRFPTEGRTFVFDMKAKRWSERKKYTAPFQRDFPVGAYVYWPSQDIHLFGSTDSAGGLYKFATTAGNQELGSPLVCERTTGWHDFGTANRKRSSKLQLTMKRGTAAQGATPGSIEVRKQDDDGPWSNWVQVSVGNPNQFEQVQKVFATNGIFRRRRYEIRYSNTEETALAALHDDVTDLEAK